MDKERIELLFSFLRSSVCGTQLDEKELEAYSQECFADLMNLATRHDVEHLLVLGLKQNGLIENSDLKTIKIMHKAVFRYEKINAEYKNLCNTLEKAQIPFIPLKGSVLREYYPEPWMRTSCDIDILVHYEDLEKAKLLLVEELQYSEKDRTTHDVSMITPKNVSVELHFDLVEEGRANGAIKILNHVWENVSLHNNCKYMYDMTDEFFYLYHIAHMAKHFENGGCGISPFIDLWILDNLPGARMDSRDKMLENSGLLDFACVVRKLSKVWFGKCPMDELSFQMQSFILNGGVYGSTDNRVSLKQKKNGGRLGYILTRVFVPYSKLKRYYPVLEKHRWLTPIMQVKRWFMLFRPDVSNMVKKELRASKAVKKEKLDEMNTFLHDIGLK